VPTHLALGARAGISSEKLANLDYRTNPAFDAVERVILEYAEVMAHNDKVSDDLYGRLREHLSERELIELMMMVGMSHLVNRFHATFLTELDRTPGLTIGTVSKPE
jgi:alkylhydroperoxidase family enzyme